MGEGILVTYGLRGANNLLDVLDEEGKGGIIIKQHHMPKLRVHRKAQQSNLKFKARKRMRGIGQSHFIPDKQIKNFDPRGDAVETVCRTLAILFVQQTAPQPDDLRSPDQRTERLRKQNLEYRNMQGPLHHFVSRDSRMTNWHQSITAHPLSSSDINPSLSAVRLLVQQQQSSSSTACRK
ncbi:14080_t:CDS:2 [Acaulospora colombiana]|uniref:14080_t:CDS:1 n=1 Tax=Acaulospora colombiana TaxID=27376 RepID=A0ACA9JVA2_9GLOM|nr:14080_t:CDS:2 [Acaulospora colombiana]